MELDSLKIYLLKENSSITTKTIDYSHFHKTNPIHMLSHLNLFKIIKIILKLSWKKEKNYNKNNNSSWDKSIKIIKIVN